ncbi:hypothetical protein M0R72_15390 [Candidatus Pacearchaeota archaeon]|jgi:hypothetical protein|nr:hypothetical protein [Candidatus Pacearchaeota archaeon]
MGIRNKADMIRYLLSVRDIWNKEAIPEKDRKIVVRPEPPIPNGMKEIVGRFYGIDIEIERPI